MTFFVLLERLSEVTVIAAQVTVLYAVIPLWRKRRLCFAMLLAWSSSLGLLVLISMVINREFQMAHWVARIVAAAGLSYAALGTILWFVWLILSSASMLVYGAAILQMTRHFSGGGAPRPEGQEPLAGTPQEPRS